MIPSAEIAKSVAEAVAIASTTFRDDQIKAYRKAIDAETNPGARWALERILENAAIAREKGHFPLCNDTGTPHVYIEIGDNAEVPRGFFGAVSNGIINGLRTLPARPMAVKGDSMERIGQTRGLFDDPGQLVPGPFVTETVPGDKLRITVMMLGGGPELRARTYRIYHLKNAENVLREATQWAVEEVARLGCTPCVPTFGIGRTHYEATVYMLRALRYASFDRQTDVERKIVDAINATGVGPIGLGGNTTALGAFVEVGPQRAGGARIVCMRPGCCYDPRKATVELD
jgi:fumarate hydratase subunit alpha